MTTSPTFSIDTALKQLAEKLAGLEEQITEGFNNLFKENERRTAEIRALNEHLKMRAITKDDDDVSTGDVVSRAREPPKSETRTADAVDAVRIIKPLKETDYLVVEDFIEAVKYARGICYEPDLLLRLILAEKIIEQAEWSIRYLNVKTYKELYVVLRQNVWIPEVENCRAKLSYIRQGPTENVQSYNVRFREQVEELYCAVRIRNSRPTVRKIEMEKEEDGAKKTYLRNLRADIGELVIRSHPKTLAEAQRAAMEMEMWIEEANQNQ